MTDLLYAGFDTDVQIRDGEDDDGFTVDARLVPFDTPTFSAGRTSAGSSKPYGEMFRAGAFAKTIREALHRVVFRPEHGAAPIGKAVALEEREDGLYGTLRVSDTPAGRDTLTLIRDGVTPDLSIEFLPVRARKVNGILERTEVALRGVAASYRPAYTGASVLAVRDDGTEIDPEEDERDETDRSRLIVARRELHRLRTAALPRS